MLDRFRLQLNLVLICASYVGFAMSPPAFAQAPAGMVYVSNGTTASEVRQDETPDCDHWEIWLFRYGVAVPANGVVSSSSSHWGTIEGSSEQDVETKLQKEQAFDKAWAKWTGPSYNPATDLNAENPVGPICITAPSNAAIQQRRNQADQTSSALQVLEDAAFAAWAVQPGANEEMQVYLRNLDAIVQTQARMFQVLDKTLVTVADLNSFDRQFSQLSSKVTAAQQMSTQLPSQPAASASPSTAMAWASQQRYAGGIVQADQSWSADSDGQGFSVNSTVIKGYPFNQTQQIQMDIRFANIKLVEPPQPGYNATGWGSITVVLTSPLASTDTVDNSSVFLYFSTQADALAAYRYLLQAEPQH
jgi:hypothetical protein